MEGNLFAPAEERAAVASSTTCCVIGASGYIGSWLVKLLLERGYKVHATVRNPEKASHLLSLWNGGDRLRLFKADLLEEGSFDEAVNGCNGVFHVAASMEFDANTTENIESYVRSNIIDPAIKGTENLLKSCLKSKTVKRVVFTSSISTITAKDTNGDWRPVVDESCRTSVDHVLNEKASGWVYVLSKLLTEEAAFKFANENGIDLVSVITTTVAGPFLTTTVPSSIQVLLSPLTGDPKYFSILSAVNARMGSVALVHIEDICSAHIFLMEQTRAEGKYICCVRSCPMSELIHRLAQENPTSNMQRLDTEEKSTKIPEISSKKLRDLGFTYRYGIEYIIHQTITACVDHGILQKEPVARDLHEIDDSELRNLLNDIPLWVKCPDYERVDWLNKIISDMWLYLDKAICASIRSTTEPMFAEYIGKFQIKAIKYEQLTLGTLPPDIYGLKICETNENELVLEPAVRWAGNPNIILMVKILTFRITIQIIDIQIFMAPRITLKPLVATIPCFANASISLLKRPEIDFGMNTLGGDVMAIPGLYHLVQVLYR